MQAKAIKFLVILFFIGVMRIIFALDSRITEIDFSHMFVTSTALSEGSNPYKIDLEPLYTKFGFNLDKSNKHATFTPTLGWIFLPLLSFGKIGAFIVWNSIQFLCLLFSFYMMKHIFSEKLAKDKLYLICCIAIFSNPFYYHFYFSQTQFLLFALILIAYYLHQKKFHYSAVFFVILAGVIKIFPFVLLPWFILRSQAQCKMRLLLILESILLILFFLSVTDIALWHAFLGNGLKEIARFTIGRSSNYSLPSFIINLYHFTHGNLETHTLQSVWINIAQLFGLLMIWLCYIAIFTNKLHETAEFSILLIAMLTGGIICWVHYLVFLIFPVFCIISSRTLLQNTAYKLLSGFIFFVLFITGSHVIPSKNIILLILLNYIPLYAMLLLLFLLLKRDNTRSEYVGPAAS